MNKAQKIKLAQALEEQIIRNKLDRANRIYSSFYEWQHAFNAATKDHTSCMLMAANQVGKTRTGTCIDGFHLTGNYPDDWSGHKFERPVTAWLLGYSGEKTRDLLQHKLFGRMDPQSGLEGGLIPKELIIDYKSMKGISGSVREVRVKHVRGVSVCQFWSYSQGQHALMGDVVDWYHIDEEPEDQEIFPQVITRIVNGDRNRGGRGILTFTPENGKTELVTRFMDEPESSMFLQRATWDEAPHLSEEAKTNILSQYPAYQRDMRSKGEPLMGTGLIFDVDSESLICEPFAIPEYWFIINGMDFGWDHPQAHIQLVWNRDENIFYVTANWKASKTQPYEAWHIVKSWAENVPIAWPADGLQHKQQLGKEAVQQRSLYEEEGFNMLSDHATWEEGGNGVWVGIMELTNLMKSGRLKIFKNCFDLLAEIRQYHTKTGPNGKIEIVKTNDDLLDALRYAYMMRRYASRIFDLNPENIPEHTEERIEGDIYA